MVAEGVKGCSINKGNRHLQASGETCQNLFLVTAGIIWKSIIRAVTRGRKNTSSRDVKFCKCSMRAIMVGFSVIVKQIRLRKIVFKGTLCWQQGPYVPSYLYRNILLFSVLTYVSSCHSLDF